MEIREITSFAELTSLKASWDDLLADSDHDFFSTWTWLVTWCKHFEHNRKIAFLVAEDHGELVAAAPLICSFESKLGLQIGKIQFAGAPDSDYNDFIIRHGENTHDVFRHFLRHLQKHRRDWTLLELTDIPESATCLPFFQTVSTVKQSTKCSYLPLPESYDAFLKSLSYKQRGSVNNTMHKIEKNFTAELVDYSFSSSCGSGLRALIDLHQKRWQAAGCCGAFADETVRNFHFDVAQVLAEKKMLGLYILEFDGKPVSGTYGFRYGSKYYAYLPGFDPEYAKFGVGSILVPYLVRQFIAEGLNEVDLMRGDEGYKERWNAIPKWNYTAVLKPDFIAGKVRYGVYSNFCQKGVLIKDYFQTKLKPEQRKAVPVPS